MLYPLLSLYFKGCESNFEVATNETNTLHYIVCTGYRLNSILTMYNVTL